MHHPVIDDNDDKKVFTNPPVVYVLLPVPNYCPEHGGNDGSIAFKRCSFINYYCPANNVDLVLAGHMHRDFEKSIFIDDYSHETSFIQTRSATKDDSGFWPWEKVKHGYRIIDVKDGVISHSLVDTYDFDMKTFVYSSEKKVPGFFCGMGVYDKNDRYTGSDLWGNVIREIPDSYYTGVYDGRTDPPQVLIAYSSELTEVIYFTEKAQMVEPVETSLKYSSKLPQAPFNFTIRDKTEGEITEYRYENVILTDVSNASVDLTLANPDYTMEVDYYGDGTDVREIEPEVAIIRETTNQLHTGWNLISIPLVPENTSTAFVLAPITGKYDIIWEYNASDTTDHWKKYDPNAPFGNDLTNTEPGKGYWILITSDSTLPITGTVPESTDINLKTGWNLIGYNSLDSQPITDVLSSINDNYNIVWEYDASDTIDHWKKYDPNAPFGNDLVDMEPGKGYWILMNSDGTL